MANDNLARLPTDSDVDNEEQSAGQQPGFSVIQGGNQGDGNPRAKMRVVPKKSGGQESDKPVTVVSNDPNNKTKVTQVDFKQERKGELQSQPGTVSPFRSKTAPRNTAGDNSSALNAKQNVDQQQSPSNNGYFDKEGALEDQTKKNDESLGEEQPKEKAETGTTTKQQSQGEGALPQEQQKEENESPVEFAKRHKKDYDERVKKRDEAKAKADSPEEVPKSEATAEGQAGTPGKGSVKAGEELAEEGVEDASRIGGAARTVGRGAQAERAAAGVIRGGAEVAEVAGTAAKAGVGLTGNAIKAGVAGAEAGSKAANISGALAIGGAVIDAGADIANRKHKIEEASGLGKVTETAKLGADIAIDAAAAVAETAATAANVAPGVGVAINIAIESAKAVIKSGLDDMAVWLIAICILCLVSIVLIPIGFLPLIVLDAFLVGSIIGIRQPMGWMKMTITGVLNAIYLIGIAFWFALFFVVLCNLPGAQWLSTAGNVTSYVPGATYFVPGLEKLQALSQICAKLSLNAGAGGGGNIFGGGVGNPIPGAGTCTPITDDTNPCSVNRLTSTCLSWNAEQASGICNKESNGGDANICSGSDRCLQIVDGEPASYSCGLFQINMLDSYGEEFKTECQNVLKYDSKQCSVPWSYTEKGDRYCLKRDCSFPRGVDQYRICRDALKDPVRNARRACELYNDRCWQPWTASANRCNIPSGRNACK